MNILSTIILILLTLAGYSAGAVIARRGKKKLPELFDVGVAVLLLAAALETNAVIGRKIMILVWLILAGFVSALLTKGLTKEGEIRKGVEPAPVETGLLRRAWAGWKAFAGEVGNYQGRLLLAFFYFIIVTPFGIGVRLFSDPLKVKPHPRMTCWSKRDSQRQELEAARAQF
jgi:hypothetical protein